METITKKRLSTSTGLPMLKPMSKRQMVKKFKKYENAIFSAENKHSVID